MSILTKPENIRETIDTIKADINHNGSLYMRRPHGDGNTLIQIINVMQTTASRIVVISPPNIRHLLDDAEVTWLYNIACLRRMSINRETAEADRARDWLARESIVTNPGPYRLRLIAAGTPLEIIRSLENVLHTLRYYDPASPDFGELNAGGPDCDWSIDDNTSAY